VAKGPAAAAAQKAAQAFVAGDNVATRTGAYGARDKVTASSCAWCARKKSFVTAIYRGGGHIEGELFTKNTFTVTGPTKGVYTRSSSIRRSASTERSAGPGKCSTATVTGPASWSCTSAAAH